MNEATIPNELFAAICHNEADGVSKFLAAGADVNDVFPNKLTPLMVAARAGAHAVIPVLLDAGAEVNAQDCLWRRSAFHWLCCQGLTSHYHVESHTESARALLSAGANAYLVDAVDETPLLLALRHRLRNVIRLIHAHSPIPRGSGNRLLIPWLNINYLRRTTPSLAAYTDEEIHDLYIKPPAPRPLGTTLRRRTPIPYDASWAKLADLYAADRRGYTALHHAAAMGLYEVACILIARGAVVDAPARSGATPLMVAARCGRRKVGHLLLAHGADARYCDCHGRNAQDYARRAGNHGLFG